MIKRKDILYPDLSYKIIGILFDVYNDIGPGYREKHYEKALCIAFANTKLAYKNQVHIPLHFNGKVIGRDFLDFLIEDKIVLELKRVDRVSRKNIGQVYEYLCATNLRLGIIAQFSSNGLEFKRVVNIV